MIDIFENIVWKNEVEIGHLIMLLIVFSITFLWEMRKQKPRKILRVAALLLSLGSLYCIYLSPHLLTSKPLKSVLFISQGIEKSVTDSLKSQFDLPVLVQQKDGQFLEIDQSEIFNLAEFEYKIDTAFVYGYFPHLNPWYYKSRIDLDIHKGFTVGFPESIGLGDSLKVSIKNLERRNRQLSALVGLDSLSKKIKAGEEIHLASLPKAKGYLNAGINSNYQHYEFSVKVAGPEQYVIQILSAAPDFEWKFFSRYLNSKEHSVFQRTKITKDKYKSSFFNWSDSLQIDRRVAKDLQVLFTDTEAWKELSVRDKSRYIKTLKKNRGSLIFRSSLNSQITVDLEDLTDTKIFSTNDNVLESEKYKYLDFNNLYDLDEVVPNAVFRYIESDIIYGVLNFQNSYQLKLSGNNVKYEELWLGIFHDLVRRKQTLFYSKSKWPVEHQPFFFRSWSDKVDEEILIINHRRDTIKLEASKDFFYPERQHYMFYPKEDGQYFIKVDGVAELIPFFVHSDSTMDQSEFLRNYNHDNNKYRNFADHFTEVSLTNNIRKTVTLWFFLLFIISVGYLWIEDKIA